MQRGRDHQYSSWPSIVPVVLALATLSAALLTGSGPVAAAPAPLVVIDPDHDL